MWCSQEFKEELIEKIGYRYSKFGVVKLSFPRWSAFPLEWRQCNVKNYIRQLDNQLQHWNKRKGLDYCGVKFTVKKRRYPPQVGDTSVPHFICWCMTPRLRGQSYRSHQPHCVSPRPRCLP